MRKKLPNVLAASLLAGALAVAGANPAVAQTKVAEGGSILFVGTKKQARDAIKDTAVVTQVPELGPTWERQVAAQADWTHFTLADFKRLKSEFGVNWALVPYPQPPGLECRWHNDALSVCQIP